MTKEEEAWITESILLPFMDQLLSRARPKTRGCLCADAGPVGEFKRTSRVLDFAEEPAGLINLAERIMRLKKPFTYAKSKKNLKEKRK
ncbi:hypothetical protein LPTSP1_26840 [Leptospira johnsonii]|uniref:Uncharacterized protein n=1 Tax=Leptospira johnsonii TaxID=1917820 RepID=A0A2P2D4W4_9LEPT|nr:hypothetical protein LPTSP1_26840 [Leptospira johnsonii]